MMQAPVNCKHIFHIQSLHFGIEFLVQNNSNSHVDKMICQGRILAQQQHGPLIIRRRCVQILIRYILLVHTTVDILAIVMVFAFALRHCQRLNFGCIQPAPTLCTWSICDICASNKMTVCAEFFVKKPSRTVRDENSFYILRFYRISHPIPPFLRQNLAQIPCDRVRVID